MRWTGWEIKPGRKRERGICRKREKWPQHIDVLGNTSIHPTLPTIHPQSWAGKATLNWFNSDSSYDSIESRLISLIITINSRVAVRSTGAKPKQKVGQKPWKEKAFAQFSSLWKNSEKHFLQANNNYPKRDAVAHFLRNKAHWVQWNALLVVSIGFQLNNASLYMFTLKQDTLCSRELTPK